MNANTNRTLSDRLFLIHSSPLSPIFTLSEPEMVRVYHFRQYLAVAALALYHCNVVAFRPNNCLAPVRVKCDFLRKGEKSGTETTGYIPNEAPVHDGRRSVVCLSALPPEEATPTMHNILVGSDLWVFLLGVFPFAWATVEFWRRIMFGEAFGTGSDQIIIGVDDSPSDSRGRRVLGKGALAVAYFLFSASFATLVVVVYAILSSSSPPEFFPVYDTIELNVP